MSVYYPQAVMILRVLWEDFNLKSDAAVQKVYTLPIIARRVTVNLNDYNTADTFDAEIDYKTFPFDPRTIRSCGVSIHMENTGRIFKDDNSLNLIEPSPDNAVFQGFVDEESISFDDDKRSVRFEGRDFTSLLIDTKYLEGKPIPQTEPLDNVLTTLLSQLKSTQEIKLENRTGLTLPTLAQFYPDFGAPLAGQKNVGRDDTYWEIIQDLVQRAGLICFIELDKLVLSTPRVLYGAEKAAKFIYGRNIKTLEFKRKLGRHKGFNVTVRCLVGKEVLAARLPEEGSADWSKATGIPNKRVQIPTVNPDGTLGKPKDAPAMAFSVRNVKSKAQLIEIGQKIFEEVGRQQIEGSFTSMDMETDDALGACFDVTKIRVGSPVKVELDAGDLEGISRFSTPAARERFLVVRGYEPSVARAFAETMGRFKPVFYTKSVQFSLDEGSGFKMKHDFINFIDLDNKGIDFG